MSGCIRGNALAGGPPRVGSDAVRPPVQSPGAAAVSPWFREAADEAGFIAYVADLRQRHRRKTSFIAKLDKALVRR